MSDEVKHTVVGLDFADDGGDVLVTAVYSKAGDVITLESMNVQRVDEMAARRIQQALDSGILVRP